MSNAWWRCAILQTRATKKKDIQREHVALAQEEQEMPGYLTLVGSHAQSAAWPILFVVLAIIPGIYTPGLLSLVAKMGNDQEYAEDGTKPCRLSTGNGNILRGPGMVPEQDEVVRMLL